MAKLENRSEETKANERIRKRYVAPLPQLLVEQVNVVADAALVEGLTELVIDAM